MTETVIKLENVSKEFRLYDNPITGPIKSMLMPWRRGQFSKEFYAVKNVSMEIKRGEIVGIIGPNGAGKTTLLKMIAGLLPVDEGKITVKGKITALLALGVGVHPEFSGRENIYFGGLLLGMSKEEISRKMDSIIEFAEIGDFINQPFRTYSSGMKARLLFAISMSIDPDILIVDEALATGDSYFLSKSRKKILELCNSGATILFVSHNLLQIEELCERTYLLFKGSIIDEGKSSVITKRYNNLIFEDSVFNSAIKSKDNFYINNTVSVDYIKFLDAERVVRDRFETGTLLNVEINFFHNFPEYKKFHLYLGFKDQQNVFVAEAFTRYFIDKKSGRMRYDFDGINIKSNKSIFISINPLCLFNGFYQVSLILYDAETYETLIEHTSQDLIYIGIKEHAAYRQDVICALPIEHWS